MKTIDFRFHKRTWGHNFQLTHKQNDDGTKWQIAVWIHKTPCVGDILCLGLSEIDNRIYRILSVKSCGNPKDMYFLDTEFTTRNQILKRKKIF